MTGPLTNHKQDNLLLTVSAAGIIAGMVLVRIFFSDSHIIPVIMLLMISGLFYAAMVYFVTRTKKNVPLPLFITLFAFSVILRLLFFSAPPEVLSDDVYRYLWDGKLQTEGINPYRFPPESEALKEQQADPLYSMVAHKSYHTSYPPVSQLIFRGAYTLGRGSLYPLRIMYLLFEGIILLILFRRLKGKRDYLLIYLLCPLTIAEVYGGMHIDIAGAAMLLAAWLHFKKKQYRLFTVFFVLSVLIKYVSLVTLPLFFIEYIRENRKPGDIVLKTAAGAALAFLLFLPFLGAGELLFSQLKVYTKYWRFNGSIYPVITSVAGGGPAQWIRLGLTAGTLLFIAFPKRVTLSGKIILSVLSFFLLAPVLYPWYLLWMLPFAVFRPKKGEIALVVIIMLSYYILPGYKTEGIWQENPLFAVIQYVPFFLLFIHDILKGKYVQK